MISRFNKLFLIFLFANQAVLAMPGGKGRSYRNLDDGLKAGFARTLSVKEARKRAERQDRPCDTAGIIVTIASLSAIGFGVYCYFTDPSRQGR